MKILVYLSFILIISVSCSSLAQEQYRTHNVKSGETLSSIARDYKVTVGDLRRLNPNATESLQGGSILVIPGESTAVISEVTDFKRHKVRRKETLFSISQKYDVSIDDIRRYNKHLYSRQIKKGEKLMIPIMPKEATTTIIATTETSTSNNAKHTVLPKETKYGIARKYGITIAELEALNPNIGENLQMGTVLNVPQEAVTPTATIEEETFVFYEVLPKEGFYRLKIKLGLSEEEIIALNPYAKDGLKDGMILKIPKNVGGASDSDMISTIDLENSIVNMDRKHIAIMLPFRLSRIGSDTTRSNADIIKGDNTLRVALDFYSGALMAAQFAKDKGIPVSIDVYDTEASEGKVTGIISNNDFTNVDAIIGPLLQKNVQKAASMLRTSGTPVFSPLSNREIKLYANMFQTLPNDGMLQQAMIDFLAENKEGKNLILISDAKRLAQKKAVVKAIPGIKTLSPREKGFLYDTDIIAKIEPGKDNWVVLETADPVILSNVIGLLNGMPDDYKLRLFTLDKNDVYDYHDISNMHLAKLNFTFPSVNKGYDYKDKKPFLVSYKNKHGVLPNRYAVRGFDVTYDVLLRLAAAQDVYDATSSDYETEYIENKFRYSKKPLSGYVNNAFYIIKYKSDLQFEVVK